jgi:hypothetical protein
MPRSQKWRLTLAGWWRLSRSPRPPALTGRCWVLTPKGWAATGSPNPRRTPA